LLISKGEGTRGYMGTQRPLETSKKHNSFIAKIVLADGETKVIQGKVIGFVVGFYRSPPPFSSSSRTCN